jgi:hypothetical protein
LDVKRSRLLPILILVGTIGCTHAQLRRDTVNLSQTLTDLYEQQVLNNVARFVYDPGALPDFAYPTQGSTGVQDNGSGMFSIGWKRSGFDSAGISGMAARQLNDSWTLTPVTDPRKLELMRCAYQQAVSACLPRLQADDCIDCMKRWSEFYLGTASPKGNDDKCANGSCLAYQVQEEVRRRGIVGPDCLNGPCWFHVGSKKAAPRHCAYVGHYCDVYVWVLPGEESEQLAKLTLAILDYATHDAAKRVTKDVKLTAKLDEKNTAEVTATVAIDEKLEDVIKQLSTGQGDIRKHLRPERTPTPGAGLLLLQQNLRSLPPQ